MTLPARPAYRTLRGNLPRIRCHCRALQPESVNDKRDAEDGGEHYHVVALNRGRATRLHLLLRTMHAAEDGAVLLDTMADNAIAAMRACWCKRLNRALMVRPAIVTSALVVVVAALVASSHLRFSCTLFEFGGMQTALRFHTRPTWHPLTINWPELAGCMRYCTDLAPASM